MIRFHAFTPGVLLILAGLTVSSARGDAVRDEIALRLDRAGSAGRLEAGGEVLSARHVLPDFYQRRDFEAAWKRDGNVDALLQAIEDMQADGLDPLDYHHEAIVRLRTAKSRSPADRAELDLLLTDALLRVAYHAYFGKVDPERLDPNWNIVTDIGDADPAKFVEDAIDGGRVAEAIASVKPQEPYYLALKQALARYRGIAAAGGWPLIPTGPTIAPGGHDARVPVLRRRLAVTGDYAGALPADSTLFDGALADALKQFQYRMMMTADGVVGPGTTRALRIPVAQRIDEIRVDLERTRWVIRHLGERHVLVNVSSAQVYLLNHHKVEWSARCQVGQTARQTPIFRADMRYLVFNPDWTVPRGILAKDILPAGKRGEAILERKKLVALDRKGARVDPAAIQWSRYTASSFPYTLRQMPGPDNALGQVKFMFPNKHSVYLHDTPSRDLFDKDVRTFSSGCIRVERPLELAERLLDDRSKWSAEKIRQVVEAGRMTNVSLARPIPVLLLYFTVTIDAQGLIRFSDDLYQRDPRVLAALNEPFQLRRRPLSATRR